MQAYWVAAMEAAHGAQGAVVSTHELYQVREAIRQDMVFIHMPSKGSCPTLGGTTGCSVLGSISGLTESN
jgi:hypothetical protein